LSEAEPYQMWAPPNERTYERKANRVSENTIVWLHCLTQPGPRVSTAIVQSFECRREPSAGLVLDADID